MVMNSAIRRYLPVAFLLLIARAAFSLATHVIPEADLAKRVPLTMLGDFTKPRETSVHTGDFDVSRDEYYSLIARGREQSGRPWEIELPAATHGLWVTKSSSNRTYFFAGYTGGAGMAPPAFIVALSFDSQRRPVPFCVSGFETYGDAGIEELVDLDGTGPELIEQEFVETERLPDTRAGYYVTTLYQQRGVYWYRADGPHGARTFPLFERWLFDGDPEEVPTAPELKGSMHDWGNDPRSTGDPQHCVEAGVDVNPRPR